MIEFRMDDQVHGQYSVTMRCTKCKLAVFSGTTRDKEGVERLIRQRFAENHINCDAVSADESSAVNRSNEEHYVFQTPNIPNIPNFPGY